MKKEKKSAKTKKPAIEPVLITSREGMRAVVNNLVQRLLELKALEVRIDKLKARVTRKFQGEVDDLARQIQMAESGLLIWSKSHPEEFGEKKSIDLPDARFGFRTCPPKIEKTREAGTWDLVLTRLASVVLTEPGATEFDPQTVVFNGLDYIRDGAPEIAKERLLADRETIPAKALELAGILIVQDEVFFFDPKAETLEASAQKAA